MANLLERRNKHGELVSISIRVYMGRDSSGKQIFKQMLYLASQRIVKHWHARCQNWDLVLSQLQLMFADRAV